MTKVFYFFVLFLLTAQFFLKLFNVDYPIPLGGVENLKDNKLKWEYSSFFDGSNQTKLDNSTRENIGLYNFLIRLRNQINYYLFRKVNRSVILKNGVFVQEQYIKTIFGSDYIGENKIKEIVDLLASVSNSLEKQNKGILVIIAPNKARIYEEFIPDRFKIKPSVTNYDAVKTLFLKNNIDFIDFNSFFIKYSDTCRIPVFSKYGTHWSETPSTIAGDSIFSYVYKKLNLPFSNLKILNRPSTKVPKFTDYDLGELANIFSLPEETYYYPGFIFSRQRKLPKVIVVGDSFGKSFYGFNNLYSEYINKESQFWFYNKQIDWPSEYRGILESEFNLEKKFDKTDFYIVLFTEPNLVRGFIPKFLHQLKEYLTKGNIQKKYNEVPIIKKIRNNKEWYKSIEEKSIKNNIPIDIQLTLDALYIMKKDTAYLNIHNKIYQQIKSNPKTIEQMKEKAKGNKIPLNVQIEIDILWIIKNKY
jgi:hypothetical protein